jgi:small-conductance mechanosensitive channel
MRGVQGIGPLVAAPLDMRLLGVRFVGVTPLNAHRLEMTVLFIAIVVALRYGLVGIMRLIRGGQPNERVVFWTRQGASLVTAVLVVLGVLSIWFSDTGRLATFAGLIGAGLAFALQKAVTAFAGYLVILRGRTFTVGDRITMGGVRGDVVSLGFLQTRIMEMGEPPPVAGDPASTWVFARQYTGRIVTVTNDKVFDTPVYNYTMEFPFIWDEIRIPIPYKGDRKRAEAILLECAGDIVEPIQKVSEPLRRVMEEKYFIDLDTLTPQVFYRLTDNWIEMNLRFIARPRGVRNVKDEMSRRILERFEAEHIEIASGTYDVVGFPPIRIEGPVAERVASALEEHAAAPTRR